MAVVVLRWWWVLLRNASEKSERFALAHGAVSTENAKKIWRSWMSEYDEVCRFYTNWMHSMCTKRVVLTLHFSTVFRINATCSAISSTFVCVSIVKCCGCCWLAPSLSLSCALSCCHSVRISISFFVLRLAQFKTHRWTGSMCTEHMQCTGSVSLPTGKTLSMPFSIQ